uniref:(northern house mosquito) hypothetical protein n=1 Tax=Culex pipiens TaxID=7175 RepID=A0A8D8CAN8_CULPI
MFVNEFLPFVARRFDWFLAGIASSVLLLWLLFNVVNNSCFAPLLSVRVQVHRSVDYVRRQTHAVGRSRKRDIVSRLRMIQHVSTCLTVFDDNLLGLWVIRKVRFVVVHHVCRRNTPSTESDRLLKYGPITSGLTLARLRLMFSVHRLEQGYRFVVVEEGFNELPNALRSFIGPSLATRSGTFDHRWPSDGVRSPC